MDSVAVRPLVLRVPRGDTVRLEAELRDEAGRPIADPRLVAWSSSDSTLVSVSADGLLTAHDRTGWALVRARAGAHADSVHVAVVPRFVSVSIRYGHACGETETGEGYCWGSNGYGELGVAAPDQAYTPVRSTAMPLHASFITGLNFTCGLLDEQAYCWGRSWRGVLGDGQQGWKYVGRPSAPVVGGHRFRELSAGPSHVCGVAVDGRVFCWGLDDADQLGRPSAEIPPTANDCSGIPCSTSPLEVPGVRLASVSVGDEHTCGLDTEGRAWCWGDNGRGALGRGTVGGAGEPAPVATPLRFRRIASGFDYTCAIAADGTAYCWGVNGGGQLGIGNPGGPGCGGGCNPTPTPVAGSTPFVEIAAATQTCAIAEDGRMFCWGTPPGMPAPSTRDLTRPTPLPGDVRFRTVSVGESDACGVAVSGLVYCWGAARASGSGLDQRTFLPVPISPPGPLPSLPAEALP